MANLEPYLRHARKFGTEGVLETAGDGMSEADRLRLRIELDAIDRERGARAPRGRAAGKAAATREAVHLLAAEGLVPKAIANKLHVSDRTVRRYLGAAKAEGPRPPKSAPPARMVERSSWPKPPNPGSDMSELSKAANG